jgi:hypothetical protein
LFISIFLFGWTVSSAQTKDVQSYAETIKMLRQKLDEDLRGLFGQYDKKNNCYIKKITPEMANDGDYGDSSYFCIKIKDLEYVSFKNGSVAYILLGGPAIDKKGSAVENLPDTNEQAYAYYLMTATFSDYRKSGGQLAFKYNKLEFLTDRQENYTRIICINSNGKVGFLYQTTSFLGRGMNGFEFDTDYYIAELGAGYFSDRFNFAFTKNDNFSTYKNGACVKKSK